MPTRSRVRRVEDVVVVAVFVVALCLPLVGAARRWGVVTPEQENRTLAPFPPAPSGLRGLASFPDGFASYLRDNFGFRGTLVRAQALVRVKLLRVSASPQVTLGKDGWLYLADEYANTGVRLLPPFTPGQLDCWRRVFEARRDWLARRGVRYLLAVAPGKATIYPEHLPDDFRRRAGDTRLEQFLDYMKGHSDLELLDLRPDLYRAKALRQIYYRTDTHWNQYGAFVAYQSIVRRLSQWYPALRPASESDCQIVNSEWPGGDLARLLGLGGLMPEEMPLVRLRSAPYRVISSLPLPRPESVNMVTERDGTDLPRLVMFHDSFSSTVMPLLAQHFSRAVFEWHARFDTGTVESERPDVVVEEMAESYLTFDPPVDPPEVRSLKYPPGESPRDPNAPGPDCDGGR